MPFAAAVGAVGAVAAAGIGAAASSSAAGAQSKAAGNAAAQNLAEFQLNYNTQHPFVDIGQNAGNALTDLINSGQMGQTPWQYRPAEDALNRLPQNANLPGAPTLPGTPNLPGSPNFAAPILPGSPAFEAANLPNAPNFPGAPPRMTQAQLEATPGYQFNLSQGLKATQSAAAAKGLGVSGAALKGASTYATGLADSTYQNQFNNAQQIYTDLFNNAQTGYTDAFNTGQQRYTDAFNNAQQGYTDAFNTGQQNYTDLFNNAQQGYTNTFNTTQQDYTNKLQNVQQNYQNQFNTQQQAYLNAFNTNQAQATGFMNLGQAQTNRLNQQYANLLGATAIGANAASGLGSQGVTSAANTGNFLTQAGNAQAAGLMGTGNALSNGISNAVNQYQQYNALQNVLAQQNPLLTNSYASAPGANTSFNVNQTPTMPTINGVDPTGMGYQPAYLSGGSIY